MTAEMGARVLAGRLPGVRRPGEVLVLAVLALVADESGTAVLTWQELAERARVSTSTLGRVLGRLEEEGFFRRYGWSFGSARGATVFRLSDDLLARVGGGGHGVPVVGMSGSQSSSGGVGCVTGGVGVSRWSVEDALRVSGARQVVGEAAGEGWCGPASEVLGRAVLVLARGRLGWIARRRRGLGFEDAVGDVAGVMWEVIREHHERVVAADSPWGWVATVVARRVGRVDVEESRVVAAGEGEIVAAGGRVLEEVRGVSGVLLEDLLGAWGGPHQVLVRQLVGYGVGQGLAWSGTRRLVEVAAANSMAVRITRARADEEMRVLGVSAEAAGAWMSLIVGTRRGGPASSFVLRVAGGGVGVTADEDRRFRVVAAGV